MDEISPVPINLLPPATTPLSFHAWVACPLCNLDPHAIYVSLTSQLAMLQSLIVAFRVADGLHICNRTSVSLVAAMSASSLLHISFSRELALMAATKLTLVLLQNEWPEAPRDQAHDPRSPPA